MWFFLAWLMCEINFVVSFITINVKYVLFRAPHFINCKLVEHHITIYAMTYAQS